MSSVEDILAQLERLERRVDALCTARRSEPRCLTTRDDAACRDVVSATDSETPETPSVQVQDAAGAGSQKRSFLRQESRGNRILAPAYFSREYKRLFDAPQLQIGKNPIRCLCRAEMRCIDVESTSRMGTT